MNAYIIGAKVNKSNKRVYRVIDLDDISGSKCTYLDVEESKLFSTLNSGQINIFNINTHLDLRVYTIQDENTHYDMNKGYYVSNYYDVVGAKTVDGYLFRYLAPVEDDAYIAIEQLPSKRVLIANYNAEIKLVDNEISSKFNIINKNNNEFMGCRLLNHEKNYGNIDKVENVKRKLDKEQQIKDIINASGVLCISKDAKILDTKNFPNVTSIRSYEFSSNTLERIIIRNNISSIGSDIMNYGYSLKELYLDSNINKIDANAFKHLEKYVNTVKIYVVAGGSTEKQMKRRRLPYILIDDIDKHLFKQGLKGNIIDETEQSRFIMLLHGTQYEYITEDENLPYAKELYRAIKELETNPINNIQEKKLNTDKFIYGYSMNLLGSHLLEKLDSVHNNIKNMEKPEEFFVKQVFIGLSNLITSLFDNNTDCYKEDFLKTYINIQNAGIHKVIYIDGVNAILQLIDTNKVLVLCIIHNRQIVFMQSCLHEVDRYIKSMSELSFAQVRRAEYLTLLSNMEPCDYITFLDASINSVHIPTKMLGDITGVINNRFYLLYVNEMDTKKAMIESTPHMTLFYDCIEQRLLLCEAKFVKHGINSIKLEKIDTLKVISIYDLDDINKIGKKYLKQFTEIKEKDMIEIKSMSMSKNDYDNLFADKTNYDNNLNEDMIKAAVHFYRNNIKTVDNFKIDTFKMMIKSGLILPVNMSYKDCEKKEIKFQHSEIKDTDELITVAYTKIKNCFRRSSNEKSIICGQLSKSTNIASKKELYISLFSLNNIIKTLYIMGEHITKNTRLEKVSFDSMDTTVKNEKINIDNFIVIHTTHLSGNGRKLLLTVNKFDGKFYFVGEIYDMDFYTLFKFNTFKDVITFYETINSTSYDYGKLETLLNNIHAMTDDITTINEWAELRNLIVRGFPNGYPYSGEHYEIFNILSKQP